MNRKIINWLIAIISTFMLIVGLFVLFMDLSFFITRQETTGIITSITKPSDYRIDISYYNGFLKKEINTTVKLKASYSEIEKTEKLIPIYYGKYFPRNIYLTKFKVPKKAILVLEFVVLFLIFVGLISSIQSILKSKPISNNS